MVRFRRKHAILIAAAGLIASTAALIGLRIGRPVYYSDGNRAFAASELRHASMLRWGAPQPEFALPGPVRGRVAQLPDGRLLYGRVRSPHRTDLVLFDPEFPTQEPEPVLALCSEAHDLSPVVTGDGTCTVWFASDRGSGAGGFDLYRADYHQGVFYGVAPLDQAGVNTIFDETDPAPDVGGGQLVFVRRDPGLIKGRNATLWIASLAGSFEARPLLEPDQETGRLLPALDRDPAFSPGGKAIYFVRQHPLEEPVLMQTFHHRGRWVKPLPVEMVEAGTTTAAMRGPALLAGGFDLRLVQSGSGPTGGEALTYRSRAREVRPYWDGQAYMESLLVSLVLFFLTLLALLTLGARWHHLDLITKLFLVSVVIHVLLLLWLSRMEIVRSFLPDQPQPGQLEVTILAAAHGDRTPGTEAVVAQTANVARQAAFNPEESALDAAAPGVEIGRQQRPVEHSLTAVRRPKLRPALATDAQGVVEPAPVVATRTGRSQDVAVSPARIAKTRPGRLREMAARQQQQQPSRRIEVTTPGSDIPATPALRRHRSVPGANSLTARVALPQPRTQGLEPQRLHDAPAPQPARTGTAPVTDDITPLATANRTTPTPAVVVLRPTPGTQGEQRAADLDAKPAASLVARNKSDASLPPVPSAGMTTPLAEPRTIEPGGLALKDSSRTRPNSRRGAMATAATEASAVAIVGLTLDAIAQARPGASVPAPKPDHDTEQPLASTSGPAPASLLDAAAGRRQPGPLAARTMPPARALSDLAPFKDLRDLPARTNGTAEQPGTGPSTNAGSAPAAAPLAAAVLPKLAPLNATAIPERHHPDRDMAITGGLQIPGSFLERVTRHPQLPGSSSALAALDVGLFRNRFGSQKAAALRKYGGGEDTERAVRLGLDYLAGIQNRDGSWGRRRKHNKYGRVQVGKTALCLLAFLGAGHTHQSRSKHRKVAKKAIDFLLRVQDDATGHFGATSTYSHGIATYALAECYAMTSDKKLHAPLEYAVTWTLVNQNHTRDRRNRGGWGYFSPSLRPEDSYARASTTAWQVMALKSAQLSGIKVAEKHLRLAEQFLWRCYDRRHGYFLYTHKPSRLRTSWRTLPASTPASCFCLLLLGNDPDDARIRAGLEYTVDRRPRRYARASSDQFVRRAAGNVYFWYYGSLAAFMAGGDNWRTWNRALKRVLLRGQSEDGSFKPIDVYAEYAGDSNRDRSYTTAMCVLSLEIYYRYFTPLLKQR